MFSVNRLAITAILQMCTYSYAKYDRPQRRNVRECLDPPCPEGEGVNFTPCTPTALG